MCIYLMYFIHIYSIVWGFRGGSVVKNAPVNAGSIPGSGNGNLLHWSCLGNLRDRGAWQNTVHGSQRVREELVTKQQHSIVWHSHLTLFFFFKAQYLLFKTEFLMNLHYAEKMPMATIPFQLLRSPGILLGSCMTMYIWIVTYKLISANCSENVPRERLCFRKICIIMNFHFC